MIALLLFVATSWTLVKAEYVRVCYYTNWSQYRPSPMQFRPEHIDPFLCTHLNYAFAKIGKDHTLHMIEWNDDKMYREIIDLKNRNPKLKILLSIGGKFSKTVSDDTNSKIFIDSSINLLYNYGFDGIDVDWEFPAWRPSGEVFPEEKQMFTKLCKELDKALIEEASKRQSGKLLFTAAVASPKGIIDVAYEVKEINKYLDYLNVMTYDLHGSWDRVTGHHTAMAADGYNPGYRSMLTVPFGINHWIQKGFPAQKIVLGMATYGRSFRLKDATKTGLGAPAASAKTSPPPKGNYTQEEGFLAYYEICNRKDLTVVENNLVHAPYAYNSKDKAWIGFDNQRSLKYKIDTLIKGKGLAGAMFWSLALDDFNSQNCNQGKFPLIGFVKNELGKITAAKTTMKPSSKRNCFAIGRWKGNSSMNRWCRNNCAKNNCPKNICTCA